MNKTIENFLSRFHYYGNNINDVFTLGCCYWFALILLLRFAKEDAEIMYDQVMCHFGTKINDRVYDITGDVTDRYQWIPWSEVDDELLRKRIIRDCIMF